MIIFDNMKTLLRLASATLFLALCCSCSAEPSYEFDGSISEDVLHNYLSRAITLSEFLTVDPYCVDGKYPDKDADIRFILNTGTKFVGRAIYRWGHEEVLNEPAFWAGARNLVEKVHAEDPDIIFQAAVFEAVYPNVTEVKIPAWAFEALGLPVEDRNFRYEAMLFPDGLHNTLWGKGGVPDIRQAETQLWYMYLIGSYVDSGCEAVHLGQVYLTGSYDNVDGRQWVGWDEFLTKVRAYVNPRARRHYVLFDCHGGPKGVILDGRSLIDFNAFPLRIKEVPSEPLKGVLEMDWSDSVYGHHLECTTPSGWHTEALPNLVEFDNFGHTSTPGQCRNDGYTVWGYDEISWFWLKSREDKMAWLDYAYEWIREHDPICHLQMPGARVVDSGHGPVFMSRAVAPSDKVKYGMDIEDKVKELFSRN